MDIKILIPRYNGLESEYEDIFYAFMRSLARNYKFIFRVKKSRSYLDNILSSQSGLKGKGKADGYLMMDTGTGKDFLIGILELESTGNLDCGIEQNAIYIKSILKEKNMIFEKNKFFLNIVYDGKCMFLQKIYLGKYKHKLETIYNKTEITEQNQSLVTNKIIEEIKELNIKTKLNKQVNEQNLINSFKKKIRGKDELKKYRAEMMTMLASIYDITNIKNFNDALDEIQKDTNEICIKIKNSWGTIKNKINYNKYKDTISDIYTNISIPMFELLIEKDVDLYGFFYEELAEKDNKKEQGEFYTPRHIISPIISSVYNNFLSKYKWENRLDKVIVCDPFCGSGGFLYEYIKLIEKKTKADSSEQKQEIISNIAKKTLFGYDIIDDSSARLNMYLVGDGNVNLYQVTTSIGWRQRYIKQATVNKKELTQKIKNKINENSSTINSFLQIYLNEQYKNKLIQLGYINNEIKMTPKMINKLSKVENEQPKYNNIDEFLKDILLDNEEKNIANNPFGNVDLLMTNVPYGTMAEADAKFNCYDDLGNSRYETNAIKDCVDLLKPEEKDGTGEIISYGGIAIIIVPSGILETKENYPIRKYIIMNSKILGVIKLPKYTFAPYTTQQTYVLVLKKRSTNDIYNINNGNFQKIEYKNIFMYISDRDGKMASDKRTIINKMENGPLGIEYIHDDFSQNFGKFDGNYKSKIERCWDQGMFAFNKDYNQERKTDKWDGKQWTLLGGNKWGFYNVKSVLKEFFSVRIIPQKYMNEIKCYCTNKKLKINDFFELLHEDLNNIDFNFEIKEKDKSKIIISKSYNFINKFNKMFIFDDYKNTWNYVEKDAYYDFDLRPETYLLNSSNNTNDINNKNIEKLEYKYIWEVFNCYGEDNITEDYIYNHTGEFPVFSGQTENDGIIGYINTAKYDGEFLTWTTYGSAGKFFYRNCKFNIGRNCAALKLKNKYKDKINLSTIKNYIEEELKKKTNSEDTRGSAPLGVVLSIKIPILKD